MLANNDKGMRFSPDLSVLWREHLANHDIGYPRLIEINPARVLVFEARVGEVRDLKFEGDPWHVVYTPMPEEEIGCSHVSVLVMRDVVAPKFHDLRRLAREMLGPLFEHRYGDCDLVFPED